MFVFIATFYLLFATVLCLSGWKLWSFWKSKELAISGSESGFIKFRNSYLIIYLLGVAGDWLQGPYVYALYDHYKMSKRDIEFLFVAGFGASMLIGTFVGSFADRYGRKKNCILYGILYGLSCLTKHFNNFWILFIGRILGGTATSILYSAFESWLVHEHHVRGYSEGQLNGIFSLATFGNSFVAIVSGVVAQYSVDWFGYVAPFDVSLIILIIMTLLVVRLWNENYGDETANTQKSFTDAWNVIIKDKRVLCLGIIQSLFEGSMFCFILEWTPTLTPRASAGSKDSADGHVGKIPHGYIFAAFMMAMMIGSEFFTVLCNRFKLKVESFLRVVFILSSIAMALPFLLPFDAGIPIVYFGFLVFEGCIGLFWPGLMSMRSRFVPEETRATIMNCFRVPLNLIVVIILTQNFSLAVIFKCCTAFIAVTAAVQFYLHNMVSTTPIAAGASPSKVPSQVQVSADKPIEADDV